MKSFETKDGRYQARHTSPRRRKRRGKSLLPLCLILILGVCLTIGCTLAFMQAKTEEVKNTFRFGDITYTLNLEANAEGVEMPTELDAKQSTALSVEFTPDKTPSKAGYAFGGWYYDQECTELHTEAPGTSITVQYDDPHDSNEAANKVEITLYAKWERKDFTVTFDTQADNVTADPASKTVTYQMAYGDLPVPTRTGYTFDSWTLEPNGGDEITSNSIVGIAADHTLYAQWTPYTYTVQYDKNVDPDDTSVTQPTGSTADSIHTYDAPQKLTENGFSRTGYTFIGWNTQPDGSGDSYANGEAVTNLTSVQNGIVTLYAQWGVKTYILRYHANGGEGEMPDQVIEWDKLTKIRENTFTNNNGDYKFAGWATSPDGEVVYLENQQIVNLLESGTLDLYAVWLLNSYTVTFDYNLGWGTPPTKEVLYGEPYGVLPPYLGNQSDKLFIGWYTEKDGGERVYPETIVNLKEDHTLYAHWEDSPANDIIMDLVIHNSADDNQDGIADEIHLEFVCSSSYEKYNIPIKNLVPGQTYTLTYTTSNNASFGDYIKGYQNARYGSYILPTATNDRGNIDDAVATDIIATWSDRIEADGTNDGSQEATNDAWLNGPWTRTITFTATQETMYWAWEFGLIQDSIKYDYNIYDISLEPVVPTINFANKKVLKGTSSSAKIASQTNDTYSSTFTFDGDGGCETVYYPITGLTAGTTYTITFDHEFSGPLIHDTKSNSNPTYEYGCGIMNAVPTKTGDKMANLGTWASSTFVKKTVDGKVDSVTLTFTAASDTAYWVWNMANCSDSTNTTTKVTVTNFSAKHSGGGSITYYTAASNAGNAITLALMPEEAHEIQFIWEGIDDTNMEIWYPVDEQYPAAGESYELAFEPLEGYVMAETITVVIDDMTYVVYTSGQITEGVIAPTYDPDSNILTIPAELLTSETSYVSVIASAVPAESETAAEPTESESETETEPTETESETAAEPTETESETATELVESESETETEPTETESETAAEPTETESETAAEPTETESETATTEPTETESATEPASEESEPSAAGSGDAAPLSENSAEENGNNNLPEESTESETAAAAVSETDAAPAQAEEATENASGEVAE